MADRYLRNKKTGIVFIRASEWLTEQWAGHFEEVADPQGTPLTREQVLAYRKIDEAQEDADAGGFNLEQDKEEAAQAAIDAALESARERKKRLKAEAAQREMDEIAKALSADASRNLAA